jgi:hypothetical protein
MAVKLAEESVSALQFTCRLSCPQVEQLWHMYQAEWWSCGREIEDVRRAVQHSDLIFAFCNSETGCLAAFARVLTDYVYKAVIFDVIVDRPHRATGAGRLLLEAITSPSRPREFHPEPLTDPYLSLSTHTARATH